ncbi:topology modulation protein [Lederbergia citrea]|uniref:topology modulation protein n=1 Tax=Lederbergia citrea TaxID=2833581 RepID=UPI001BC91E92|nr:topology modulation protein [Lederbergia citrea]MBS4179017.1 topology modulation protein [Lederbergia citrea]MBS4205676.1 topology modulation protein [Lederbergia citrea]
MKRIMVVGVSSGVGKSTFAQKLGQAMDIKVYHLDTFYWTPGWVEASTEAFSAAQEAIVLEERWIIEGNYMGTIDIRTKYADTIIYLELPLYVCLYRVIKRWLTNIGRTRPDMGEGCKEKIDWAFIKFILTTYYRRKKSMPQRLQAFQKIGSKKTIISLKSKKEVGLFLKELASRD